MNAARFSHFLAIDWSGAAGERHKGIALALADGAGGPPVLVAPPPRGWSRTEVLDLLRRDLAPDTLVGMDLGISLPFVDCGAFFPDDTASPGNAPALWALIDRLCADEADLAASGFADNPRFAPYFRRHGGREGERFGCDGAAHRRGRFRRAESAQEAHGCKPYSNFNLVGAAQVGKSSLTGMRLLHRLRGHLPVWPIDPLPGSGSVIVEIYTTLAAVEAGRSAARSKMRDYDALNEALTSAAIGSPPVGKSGPLDDHASDALLAAAWLRAVAHDPRRWNPSSLDGHVAQTEGWTFGAF